MKIFALASAMTLAAFAAGAATPALSPKSSQSNLPTLTIVERAASGQTRTFEVALDPNHPRAGVCVGIVGQAPVTTHCTFYVLGDTLFQGSFQ